MPYCWRCLPRSESWRQAAHALVCDIQRSLHQQRAKKCAAGRDGTGGQRPCVRARPSAARPSRCCQQRRQCHCSRRRPPSQQDEVVCGDEQGCLALHYTILNAHYTWHPHHEPAAAGHSYVPALTVQWLHLTSTCIKTHTCPAHTPSRYLHQSTQLLHTSFSTHVRNPSGPIAHFFVCAGRCQTRCSGGSQQAPAS